VNLTIEHIGLAAANPAALKDWFCQVFDAQVLFADGKNPPAYLLQLQGGAWVEIYRADSKLDETGNNRLAGWRHLALRVDSIEAARDHLLKRGVEFDPLIKPAGGCGRVLFFKDPEGNLWHLVERSHGSVLGQISPA